MLDNYFKTSQHQHSLDILRSLLRHLELTSATLKSSEDLILKVASFGYIPSKTIITEENQNIGYIYFLQKGCLKCYRHTGEGQESLFQMIKTSDIIGDITLFHTQKSPYTIETTEDSAIWRIPLSAFEHIIAQSAEMATSFIKWSGKKRLALLQEEEHLKIQNTTQRLGCFILKNCSQNSVQDTQTLVLPYDKILIAAELGMKPETLSRSLAILKRDVGLSVQGQHLNIPSLKKLMNYVCHTCSSHFPCKE